MSESELGIYEKWESCRFSVAFGLFAGDEAGHVLREAGFIENFACERPEVVATYPRTFDLREKTGTTKLAVFHETGKPTDPSVRVALFEACHNCRLYEPKS